MVGHAVFDPEDLPLDGVEFAGHGAQFAGRGECWQCAAQGEQASTGGLEVVGGFGIVGVWTIARGGLARQCRVACGEALEAVEVKLASGPDRTTAATTTLLIRACADAEHNQHDASEQQDHDSPLPPWSTTAATGACVIRILVRFRDGGCIARERANRIGGGNRACVGDGLVDAVLGIAERRAAELAFGDQANGGLRILGLQCLREQSGRALGVRSASNWPGEHDEVEGGVGGGDGGEGCDVWLR